MHLKYGIEPDLCIFGKALGNGYPITAVIGRESVMESAHQSFISSTFWTDRIGPTAALATLNTMSSLESWKYISQLGQYLKKLWKDISRLESVDIRISGLDAMPSFIFDHPDHLKYKTFLTQQFLHYGYLATNSVYLSTCHNRKIVEEYADFFKIIMRDILLLPARKTFYR